MHRAPELQEVHGARFEELLDSRELSDRAEAAEWEALPDSVAEAPPAQARLRTPFAVGVRADGTEVPGTVAQAERGRKFWLHRMKSSGAGGVEVVHLSPLLTN